MRTTALFRVPVCLLAVGALAAPAGAHAATGPHVVKLGETGKSRGITGFRATFDRRMNRARASDVGNYKLFGITKRGLRMQIGLRSAVYERKAHRVRVVAATPFNQQQFRTLQFRLKGRLTDKSGRRLAGGDAILRFRVFSGKAVTFKDSDGDRATIRIRKGGSLDGIVPVAGPDSLLTQFWILDPIALSSTLSGTVMPAAQGNGIVVISEIIGLDQVDTKPLLRNMSFRVNTLTFSSNATGIG